ncbi:MAG: DUF6789 family protein [Candidatus Binatia bacterium]
MARMDPASALKAGIAGTAIMTVIMYSLPLIGIPRMDIMAALGSIFPLKISPYILGFLIHFGIGIALALIYAAFFYSWLPSPNWLKGILFSLLPWLFAITLLGPSLQLVSRVLGAAPSISSANPCATANPCAPKATVNPCAPKVFNPCAPANPCAVKIPVNPCAPQTANPCATKPANPCAPGAVNPCAVPANPCAAKPSNPCAPAAVNPCAPGAQAQGNIPPQVLSLIVHVIYGAVVGALYRPRT